ncbi:hypothetical protein D3C87_1558960 [compost metagenome]
MYPFAAKTIRQVVGAHKAQVERFILQGHQLLGIVELVQSEPDVGAVGIELFQQGRQYRGHGRCHKTNPDLPGISGSVQLDIGSCHLYLGQHLYYILIKQCTGVAKHNLTVGPVKQ